MEIPTRCCTSQCSNHCYSINPIMPDCDYDDFVFPDIAKHLPYFYKNEIIIGTL